MVFIRHQVALEGHETVNAKRSVEREAALSGIKIKEYHSNNGIFNSAAFEEALETEYQVIFKSGVGAKH